MPNILREKKGWFLRMVKSHYDNIPNWETIKKRIFERDNYQCQKCHIKHGTITHQPRYYYPRYAEQLRGGLFLFYGKLTGQNIGDFTHVTFPNIGINSCSSVTY